MEHQKIGEHILYLGDMREALPLIAPVNMIMTDPPYRLISGGGKPTKNGSRRMAGCFDPNEYNNNGSLVTCNVEWEEFIPALAAIMPQGDAYFMANDKNVRRMLNAAALLRNEKGDPFFDFHNLLVWDKRTATANMFYMKNCEYVGYFFTGKARIINDCASKQLIFAPQVDESHLFSAAPNDPNNRHPTEKPVALMAHYIKNSTDAGQIVLDPFMGTGTTGVACVKTGRRFIGVEITRKWFDIACRRIERAVPDNGLFG